MFGELPKLLGKNFILGFFAPSAVFIILSSILISRFSSSNLIIVEIGSKSLFAATSLLFGCYLVSVILLGMNHAIIMFLEGYRKFWFFNLLLESKKKKFDDIERNIEKLKNRIDNAIQDDLDKIGMLEAEYTYKSQEIAENYPDRDFILPTSLGNRIRAFEVYSRVVYGLDAIPMWTRILSVIPEKYQKLIDDAKSQFDFWLNSTIFLLLLFAIDIVAAVYFSSLRYFLESIAFLILAVIGYRLLVSSAKSWGQFVMGAFDLFKKDLATQMGYEIPRSIEREREFWRLMSQTMMYRSEKAANELTQYKPHTK